MSPKDPNFISSSRSMCAYIQAIHILVEKLESLPSEISEVPRDVGNRVRLNVVSDGKAQADYAEIVGRVAEEVRVND